MFGRWIRSLSQARPRVAGKSPDAHAPDTAPHDPEFVRTSETNAAPAAVSTSAPVPVANETARPGSDYEAFLSGELTWRGRSLLASFEDLSRFPDVQAIVDSLASDRGTLLRQPPRAAQRALTMARSSDTSVGDLVGLLESDPGLAQSLLKQANSVFYSTGAPCTSLSAGVQRVGMVGVENVLLASMVEGMLCRPGNACAAMMEQAWSHMVRSAPIARRLSPVFGVQPEQAFTIALLHDAGKLVLFDRITTLRSRWRREPHLPPAFLPRALNLLHECIGGLAALSWGLGEPAARAIATHHRTHPPTEPDLMSEVIYLAEHIDMAEIHGQRLDLDRLWEDGKLTFDPAPVKALFEEPEAEAA